MKAATTQGQTFVPVCRFRSLKLNNFAHNMTTLQVGQPAPTFTLPDQQQQNHALSDYRGQWVVLFFYPKDNTPGCTIEACQFRDHYREIVDKQTQILGINTDSIESHRRFTTQKQLPFPLLSDRSGQTCEAYDTLFKLGPIKFCKRHSFIISPDGKIAKIYRKVSPGNHNQQILDDLEALQN